MWIFTRYGFYSIACAQKADGSLDPDTVMIRARRAGHVANLQRRFPALAGAELLQWVNRDYRYRLIVPKALWVSIVAELAQEQEWSNFKNEAAEFQSGADCEYIRALHDVWGVMGHLQDGESRAPRSRPQSPPERKIVSLRSLYDFVEKYEHNEEAMRLERTALGKEYCRLCDEITKGIDPQQGFYLWGRYDSKGLWQNIYLGMAGFGRTKNLKMRIREELKDERACIWRHVLTKDRLWNIGATIHRLMWSKYSAGWDRSIEKAGATHIAWVPAPEVNNDDVRRIESDLIEALSPKANRSRPTPSGAWQQDTSEIFRSLRLSIHAAREEKFAIDCPD